MSSTLHVFTYKDGLLARLAHDLRLTITRFEVDLTGTQVKARFDVTSARVDGVAHGDRVDGTALSDKDKNTIEATIPKEILGHTPVLFDGEWSDDRAWGRLTILGRAVDVELPVVRAAHALVVETELTPSRWGVVPYRAMLGAIRLQDRWRVRLTLPYSGYETFWREGSAGSATSAPDQERGQRHG
jgi:hypothetical protein